MCCNKKIACPSSQKSLKLKDINNIRYTIYRELGQEFPHSSERLIMKISKISKDIKYYYTKRRKNDKYKHINDKIKLIAKESNYTYGKRRICQELRNKYNIFISQITTANLMKQCKIFARISKRRSKYNSYKGELCKLAPNIIKRDFSTDRPNQKIVTDVSEFKINNKAVYISPFIDLFGNRIICYTLSLSPSVPFVVAGLNKVLSQIPEGTKTIIHSDQGHQYQHIIYRDAIKSREGISQSMSRKGNCLDNGACESFFGRLKEEVFHGVSYSSIDELVNALDAYVHYYNYDRIQIELNGLSPMQYISQWSKEHIALAS